MPPVKKSRSSSNHLSDHPSNNNNHNSESSRPKLFQCKGFGDCHMVFTRSEHLARHTRKHTGEVCIIIIINSVIVLLRGFFLLRKWN